MESSSEDKDLFGSALSAKIPPEAKDVSTMREIPDNQEVFAHNQTDQSIIIEILEYVEETDQQALKTHFEELAVSNGADSNDDSQILVIEEIAKNELAIDECETAYYVLGQQKVSKFKESAKNVINIHLGLFRLPCFTTDILVSFNDPVNIDPGSSSHKPIPVSADRWTDEDFKVLLKSLKINDPGIFGS